MTRKDIKNSKLKQVYEMWRALRGIPGVETNSETQARRLFKVAITETDFRLCHVRNELHKSAGLIDK